MSLELEFKCRSNSNSEIINSNKDNNDDDYDDEVGGELPWAADRKVAGLRHER